MKKLFLSLILILLSFNLFSNEPLEQNFFSYNNFSVGIYLYEEDDICKYKINISALEDSGLTMLDVWINDINQAKRIYDTYNSISRTLSRTGIRNLAVELEIEGRIMYKDGVEIILYTVNLKE